MLGPWGDGQLGDGDLTDSLIPVAWVAGIALTGTITTGKNHSCVVPAGGTPRCWGSNDRGQLGVGSEIDPAPTPVAVTGLTDASQTSAGADHTCVVKADTTVVCWGSNYLTQLGTGQPGGAFYLPERVLRHR